jgi:hypothetical protein
MKIKDVDEFFKEVNRLISFPIRVILTGGAAGVLWGVKRVTFDIDFEVHIHLNREPASRWAELEKVFSEVSRLTHITPQFSEDIDRWSSIVLPSKKSLCYKKIGKVDLRLLDPSVWAIGKLARFLKSDVSDLVHVLREAKTDSRACAILWGRALGQSPASSAQDLFRRQVERFLDQYGKKIWGPRMNPEIHKQIFLNSARRSRRR